MRGRIAVALAAASLATVPAMATPTVAAPSPPADARARIERALALGRAGDCPGVLAILDPLVPALGPGADRNAAQSARLTCLGGVGRTAEMVGVQQELAATSPKNAYVRGMGVLVAAANGGFDVAAERLATLADKNDAEALGYIPADSWRALSQQLTQAGRIALRDRVVLALARADWRPDDLPELRDALAQGAIASLIASGQRSEAELLLPRVTIPEMLADMATERAYQPLWPEIEARMGPAQGIAADRYATTRLDAYAREPDDAHALRDAVHAFALIGRYDEANEIAAPVAVAAGMDEDAVTIVANDAQVLQSAGKPEAAVARLRPFRTIDLKTTPVAATGLVSLAETLNETGHDEEALAVAQAALAGGAEALSPWGQGWLVRSEACALARLGRAGDARAAGDRLKAQATANPPAAVEGLLCAGRTAEAAAIAIATLGTAEGASDIADQFQPDGAVWLGGASKLRAMWAGLLARPDVRAAFDRRARILPRALWPSRMPRAIPHGGTAPDDATPLA